MGELNKKKTNSPIYKWAKDLSFTKDGKQAYKRCSP